MTVATEDRSGHDRTTLGTAALSLLTVAAVAGFGRIFSGASHLFPLTVVAVGVHALAWWGRRRGLSTVATAGIALLVAPLLIIWTVLPHETTYGWPTWSTLGAAGEALSAARGQFGQAVAPVAVLPGYLIAAMVGVAVAAFMADWAAFRIRAPFEACVPAFTLFVFISALGSDRHRTLAIAAFVTGALAFLLSHQLSRYDRTGSWFGGSSSRGPISLARLAAGFGVVAVVLGLLVGPALPGANADPVVPYKGRVPTGPSNRATVSPLVDIRGRLVERSGIEVFTVETERRAYWRLTALDEFDGQIWRSEDNYRNTRGSLRNEVAPSDEVGVTEISQSYSILGLSSIWAPAAYQPVEVSGLPGASYAPASASVITESDTSDGLEYQVTSRLPDLRAEALRTARALVPEAVADRYLSLPPISSRVRDFARRLVADKPTPYDQALALQSFFRDNYVYDLDAATGHDNRTIERFLFSSRRGYCEQFAGTFAVLARAVGLPARVAVGFTPGVLGADGRYHVFDEHAHAWPEVYLHGFGWVAFEPTPGRGAPGAEGYTGVPEQQDALGEATTPTTAPPVATTDPVQDTPDTSAPDPLANQDPTVVTEDNPPLSRQPGSLVALGMLAAVVLWLTVVPLLHVAQRRARRARAVQGGAAEVVLAAWAEVQEVLRIGGVGRRASETPREFAARATGSAGLQTDEAQALRRLAALAARASFSMVGPDEAEASQALRDADVVMARVRDQLSAGDRARAALDPRPLLERWRARPRAGAPRSPAATGARAPAA